MTVQFYREGIPLHGEMVYLPRLTETVGPPDIIWFYCERPAKAGGETLVCDGIRAAEQLPASLRQLFANKRIVYNNVTSQGVWEHVAGTCDQRRVEQMLGQIEGVMSWKFDESGTLRWDWATSAFRKTRYQGVDAFVNSIICHRQKFDDGSWITDRLIVEIRDFLAPLATKIDWRAGELLMVDNSRYLHGRASQDDQRMVYCRMSLANF